jgi:hypothetical protein
MQNTDRIRDVKTVATFVTTVRCLDCNMADEIGPTQEYTNSQAKRHAGRHPGHVVVRTTTREARFTLPTNGGLPPAMLENVRAEHHIDVHAGVKAARTRKANQEATANGHQ